MCTVCVLGAGDRRGLGEETGPIWSHPGGVDDLPEELALPGADLLHPGHTEVSHMT